MAIDISSCLTAIQNMKSKVARCFVACANKGSTFNGTQTLSNLESAISLIPTGSGGNISENITGASFGGFNITYDYDAYTIDFGSIGVNWKSIVCYSDNKDGHYAIHKMSNNKCVISGAVFYDASNQFDEAFGIFPNQRNTYRATYSVSGNSITFTNAEYDGTSNGMTNHDSFGAMPQQVSTDVNDYFTNQYKLDRITVVI